MCIGSSQEDNYFLEQFKRRNKQQTLGSCDQLSWKRGLTHWPSPDNHQQKLQGGCPLQKTTVTYAPTLKRREEISHVSYLGETTTHLIGVCGTQRLEGQSISLHSGRSTHDGVLRESNTGPQDRNGL